MNKSNSSTFLFSLFIFILFSFFICSTTYRIGCLPNTYPTEIYDCASGEFLSDWRDAINNSIVYNGMEIPFINATTVSLDPGSALLPQLEQIDAYASFNSETDNVTDEIIANWYLDGGGDLIVIISQDGYFGGIAINHLGFPSSPSYISNTELSEITPLGGTSIIYGGVSAITTNNFVLDVDPSEIEYLNGNVLSLLNDNMIALTISWEHTQFCGSCKRLFFTGNNDQISNLLVNYTTLNDNAKFGINIIRFLNQDPVYPCGTPINSRNIRCDIVNKTWVGDMNNIVFEDWSLGAIASPITGPAIIDGSVTLTNTSITTLFVTEGEGPLLHVTGCFSFNGAAIINITLTGDEFVSNITLLSFACSNGTFSDVSFRVNGREECETETEEEYGGTSFGVLVTLDDSGCTIDDDNNGGDKDFNVVPVAVSGGVLMCLTICCVCCAISAVFILMGCVVMFGSLTATYKRKKIRNYFESPADL